VWKKKRDSAKKKKELEKDNYRSLICWWWGSYTCQTLTMAGARDQCVFQPWNLYPAKQQKHNRKPDSPAKKYDQPFIFAPLALVRWIFSTLKWNCSGSSLFTMNFDYKSSYCKEIW
jgi:hypothetical protein